MEWLSFLLWDSHRIAVTATVIATQPWYLTPLYQSEDIHLGPESVSSPFRHPFKKAPGGVHGTCSVIQLCLSLCDPVDCSPVDCSSSVHGIAQVRILVWVAISSSRGSSLPRDRTHISCISCIGRRILYHWATRKAPNPLYFEETLRKPVRG